MQSATQSAALRRRNVGRRLAPAVALGLAGLALAACGSAQAGAAATVGDTRISESELSVQVQESLTAKGQPVDSSDPTAAAQSLTYMIRSELIDELAARTGASVSQGDIDMTVAQAAAQQGMGVEDFIVSLAAQGFSPAQVNDLVRVNVLANAIGAKLDPTGVPETQNQAMMLALTELSDEIGVAASPRYGAWDVASLSVGPAVDDVATFPIAE